MCDSASLQERLRTQRPVEWDQLPDFSLYMDQVLSYMDRQVIRFDEDDGLGEMESRPGGEEDLADAAIHFALLSYAAGVASSRYVTLLRRQTDQAAEAAAPAKKARKERGQDA